MARARTFYGELPGFEKTAEYEDKWCEFDTPEGKTIALDSFSPEGPRLDSCLRTYSWIKTFSATAEKNARDQTLTAEGSGRKRSTSDRAAATFSSAILVASIERKAGSSSGAVSL